MISDLFYSMMKIKEPASERFLYQLWLEKPLEKLKLHTIDDKEFFVLEKGVLNTDAGPDLHNALILINGKMQRGDIEIHNRAQFWYSHGHHKDPNYNRVILHVVTADCPDDFVTQKQNGGVVPTFNFDSALEKSTEKLEEEMIPPAMALYARPCALKGLEVAQKHEIVHQAGVRRLKSKAERHLELRADADWETIFYSSLCQTLGYSKNANVFLKLSRCTDLAGLRSVLSLHDESTRLQTVQALLFGCAGFLPQSSHPLLQEISLIWQKHQSSFSAIDSSEWIFFRLRPQNFPTRRIAALAVVLNKFLNSGFIDPLLKVIQQDAFSPSRRLQHLIAEFRVKSYGYWRDHYRFGGKAATKTSRYLLGREKAADIIINTVLPVLYAFARESSDQRALHHILELYLHHPAQAQNHIITHMLDSIFSGSEQIHRFRNACFEQGLIEIYKSHCKQDRCPCF